LTGTPKVPCLGHASFLAGRIPAVDRLRFDSARTVYELTRVRNKRPLPAMRAGKVLRFYWSDVEKWLRGEDVA
jgi:hypothetical protein